MASPDKSSKDKETAEVLATSDATVKVDAQENLSYAAYARQQTRPVVTIQQIIARKGEPEPKKREFWPNMEVKHEVMWGEMPKEAPPKPERSAVTSKTAIILRAEPRKPPPQGIGSMEPPGKK